MTTAAPTNPLVELEFVSSLLADTTQFALIEDIHPPMLQDDVLRLLYQIVYDKRGRVTQATLHADLMKTPAGQRALDHLAMDFGCRDNPLQAIDLLFRQGVTAGRAEILADRIRNAAVERWVYRAVTDTKPDRYADASEFAISLAAQITDIASRAAPNTNRDALGEGADEALAHWQYQQDNPHRISGIRVNLGDFDELSGGLKPGELTLVGGNSGEGKSALMCSMALEAVLTPRDDTGLCPKAAMFSLEMSREQIAQRWIAKLAGVPLTERYPTDEQKRAILAAHQQVKDLSRSRRLIMIEPSSASTIEQITRTMIQLRQQDGIDLAFIDYAQLIRSPRGDSRYEALADISQRIKHLTDQLRIPIVMGVQLNREALTGSGAGRPHLHHIADSMDLVRSADNVHFIWTPARHLTGSKVGPWVGVACLLTEKRRNGPNLPTLFFASHAGFTSFTPVSQSTRAELLSADAQELLNRPARVSTRKAA